MINIGKNLCMGCMKEKYGNSSNCPNCGYFEGTPHLPSYLPPKTILQDRFIVGKVLDYNGEGATYIGLDTATNARVRIREYMPDSLASRQKGILKVVPIPGCETQYKSLMADFVDLSKNLMRVRALSSVVPVTDLFEQNDTIYAVYEYVQGVTLNEYLRRAGGYITFEEVKRLFTPLMAHINAMHSSNILHRGISPDTIIVDKNGNLKLVGFSISSARTARSELVAELFAGYAAPEQYKSSSWQGEYTDVYAVAATIYKALTGTMPPDAMSRATNDNLIPASELVSGIPHNISNALGKALVLSPDKRTQSMSEFMTQFSEEMDFGDSEYEEEKPVVVKKKSSTKKYVFISAGISALILLIISTIVLVILTPKDDENNPVESPDTSSVTSITVIVNSSGEEEYAAPNFVGKNYESIIINEEYTKRFNFEREDDYNEEYAKGVIVKQDPVASTPIKKGAKIKLTVSKGSQFLAVPTGLENKTLEYVVRILNDLGMPYSIQYEESSVVEPGRVIKTDLEPGTVLDIEQQKVAIIVATEPSVSSDNSSSDDSSDS